MDLLVAARRELLPSPPDPRQPILLLEGDDPAGAASSIHRSLDGAIDGRFAWIDAEASRLAEQVAESQRGAGPACVAEASPAYLHALALRYYLVKLIRGIVYFTEVAPPARGDCIRAVLCQDRDEDYAGVLRQVCALAGADCQIDWRGPSEAVPPPHLPAGWWRRWLDWLRRPWDRQADWTDPRRRIVLCGNPRILEPVCRELLDRGCAMWWLYDRLAVKSWLRWRRLGVGQLVTNSDLGRENRMGAPAVDFCCYRGVDLSEVVSRWLSARLAMYGARHSRLLEQMDTHFGRVRPDALVLDEDATPTARAAVAVARRHHVPSFVVQHGAPVCRFGFAPPAADRLLAWGASSRRQFEAWGVAAERIVATGSPVHDRLSCRLSENAPPSHGRGSSGETPPRDRLFEILLLATTPPRDARPDFVAFHFTQTTYAAMLCAAFAAVAKIPRARLIVKLHPRSPRDPVMRQVAAAHPSVETEFVASGPLEPLLARADCALSCASSAGIDATLAGVPVVQILPAGSADVLPHDQWGLIGSGRTEEEVGILLNQALARGRGAEVRPNPQVFSNPGQSAAAVADAVLSAAEPHGFNGRRTVSIGEIIRVATKKGSGVFFRSGLIAARYVPLGWWPIRKKTPDPLARPLVLSPLRTPQHLGASRRSRSAGDVVRD